jgi:hypothetical protein
LIESAKVDTRVRRADYSITLVIKFQHMNFGKSNESMRRYKEYQVEI